MIYIYSMLLIFSFPSLGNANTYFLRSGQYLKKDLAPLKNLIWTFATNNELKTTWPTILPVKEDPLSEKVVIDARASFIIYSDEMKVSPQAKFEDLAKKSDLLVGDFFTLGGDYINPIKMYITGSIDPSHWPPKIQDYGFVINYSPCSENRVTYSFQNDRPIKLLWWGYINDDRCPDLIVETSDSNQCDKEVLIFSDKKKDGSVIYKTAIKPSYSECIK